MIEETVRQSFGNDYDRGFTTRFFRRWWKTLLLVAVASAAVSLAVSLMITPRYKSSVVLFPTNSNRLTKAITADRYSLDFMDYGSERDCEYTIQILSSQAMENAVCQKFNLMEHYGISEGDAHCQFKLHENYLGNISVRRTEFLGVEVSVLDVDAQWASDIANFIASYYDTLCHQIHADRAANAYYIMDGVCCEMEREIDSLQQAGANADFLQLKRAELAEMQTRRAERRVDMDQHVSYKFWIDQAAPADKKAYPKRSIVVLLGTLGAVAICTLVLLLCEMSKRRKEEEKIEQ